MKLYQTMQSTVKYVTVPTRVDDDLDNDKLNSDIHDIRDSIRELKNDMRAEIRALRKLMGGTSVDEDARK